MRQSNRCRKPCLTDCKPLNLKKTSSHEVLEGPFVAFMLQVLYFAFFCLIFSNAELSGYKRVQKHTLKLKNPDPTKIENETSFTNAILNTENIHTMSGIAWEGFASQCSVVEFNEMKDYIRHDKRNFKCKIERLSEKQSAIKEIIRSTSRTSFQRQC